jgi:hypothetical protein
LFLIGTLFPLEKEKEKERRGQASLATEIAGMEKGNGDVGVQKGFAKMLDKEELRLRKMWCRGRRWLYLAPRWLRIQDGRGRALAAL